MDDEVSGVSDVLRTTVSNTSERTRGRWTASTTSSKSEKRAEVFRILNHFGEGQARRFAEDFARSGLAANTNEMYDRTVEFYRDVVGPVCFPLCVEDLQLFVWVLTRANYAYNSISTFVSALRSRNKCFGADLSSSDSFRLKHILLAAKKTTESVPVIKMRPLSRSDILSVFHSWPPSRVRIAAAILTGICALLRADELLALRWRDVFETSVEGSGRLILGLTIRSSKTDQAAEGQTAYLACTAADLGSGDDGAGNNLSCDYCPAHVLLGWRGNDGLDDPIFPMAYSSLLSQIRQKLGPVVGVDVVDAFGTHTLRRTGAQLLHRSLPGDSPVLMRAGRWRSLAVLEYLHESTEEKAKLASCLMMSNS